MKLKCTQNKVDLGVVAAYYELAPNLITEDFYPYPSLEKFYTDYCENPPFMGDGRAPIFLELSDGSKLPFNELAFHYAFGKGLISEYRMILELRLNQQHVKN